MGSKTGWIIGGVLLAGFGVLLVVWLFPSAPSPDQTKDPEMLAMLSPAGRLDLFLPMPSTKQTGDAGEDYAQALALLRKNPTGVATASKHFQAAALDAQDQALLDKLDALLSAAAGKPDMFYTFHQTVLKFTPPYCSIEAVEFQQLSQAANLMAMIDVKAQRYDLAEKHLGDMLMMGYHLVDERARLETVLAGVTMMDQATVLLKQLYGPAMMNQPERVEAANAYRQGLEQMKDVYARLQKICWQLQAKPDGTTSLAAGDVLNLAMNHQDPAVRVEATISLGIVKLTGDRSARRQAQRAIRQKLSGGSLVEKVAAQAAADMTVDDLLHLDQAVQDFCQPEEPEGE